MTRRSASSHLVTAAHAADAAGFSYGDTHTRARRRLYGIRAASAASAADSPATAVKSEVRGSLTRHLPRSTAADDELFAMRRAAWRKQGIVVLRISDIRDDWLRQAVVNEATRLYGRRGVA